MESITEQVNRLAEETDAIGRANLVKQLRNLAYSLETPKDTTKRIISYVSMHRNVLFGF